MDKDWKLMRYNRKDYSEVVDFPVEIVGRDGVVRRYTFEDSIRLYQRRITFAPIRYRDLDLVDAEVHHCRSRIDQLRRSYFHRFGWGTPEGQPDVEAIFGDLAGELAAFVCRVLHSPGRPSIRFEEVQAEKDGCSTWYITPEGSASGMLLYVHRFVGGDQDPVRDGFFARLKALERMGECEGDGERLLAFHHTVDCGFVLTGQGSEFHQLLPAPVDAQTNIDLSPTPWDEVLELIRRGAHEIALHRCQTIVEEQPWHRSAYVAGAMLATMVGEHAVAEELALVGSRYFPKDGVLKYYLGAARIRQGRVEDGEAALQEALDCAPGLVLARTALVVSRLRRREFGKALGLLEDRGNVRADDRRADAILDRIESWLRWRRLTVFGGLGLAAVGLATVPITWLGLVPVACGLSASFVGLTAFDRQLDELISRQRGEEIRRGLRRLAHQRDPSQVVS
ncbi:MAG: hypothetical protein H6734_01180 [Alphaproteobacteria bacterium]|nr:hypothetical protein [Alphaproteobacteria bacterium]